MKSYNVTKACSNLYTLLNDVNQNHVPVQILGKNGNGILLSEDDWNSIAETLYLNSIPGLVESIIVADNEPIEEYISIDEVNL